jgi:hypothetical protein
MRLIRTDKDVLKYVWVCPHCFEAIRVVKSTPFTGVHLRHVDFALKLFIEGCSPALNMKMNNKKSKLHEITTMFRRCYSHFITKKVLPYLVLPGPVDIDETKIGRKRWTFFGKFPTVRWAFGLFCRSTRIPIIYQI